MSTTYGIQGGKGSFNHEALLHYVDRHRITDYAIDYLYTSEAVLKAVSTDQVDYGQFAIHNAVGGMVEESIHAMAQHIFTIEEEFKIVIAHYLMKRRDVPRENITTIMTHPQVLKQCQATLAKRHPKLQLTSGTGELIDHAQAAKALAQGDLPGHIAIAGPRTLADLYELDIIDQNMQDSDNNLTSFLMVSNKTKSSEV